MGEGARLGFRRSETAVSIVGRVGAMVTIVLECDERTGARATVKRVGRLLNHDADDTRADRCCANLTYMAATGPISSCLRTLEAGGTQSPDQSRSRTM